MIKLRTERTSTTTGAYTNYEKFNMLNSSKIGWNCFDLLRRRIINGTMEQSLTKLNYIQSTGSNIVRVMYPGWDQSDFNLYVFQSGIPETNITDASFKPEFLVKMDEMFEMCAQRNIKIWLCMFWNELALPAAFSENVSAIGDRNSATVSHMISHAGWLAKRYSNHPAMGVYSIGNEYHMGVGYASAESIGNTFGLIADEIRKYDSTHLITSDQLGPHFSTNSDRESLQDYCVRMNKIYSKLDAWSPHLYATDIGYLGRSKTDGETLGPSTSNNSGYESTEQLLTVLRTEAQDKPLIIAEFGISTAIESDTISEKSTRHFKQISAGCDLALIWNTQIASQADANQTIWLVEPGTTRAQKFSKLISTVQSNKRSMNIVPCAATQTLKNKYIPRTVIKHSSTVDGKITFTSDSTMQIGDGVVVMGWFGLYGNLTAYQPFCDFRGSGQTSGFVMLGGPTTPNQVYADFRKSGGSAGNSGVTTIPLLTVDNPLTHIAIFHHNIKNIGYVIDVWVDGIFYKTMTATAMVPTPTGTICHIGGSSTTGAPITMQDFAILPYANSIDVSRHLNGEILPQSLLHVRSLNNTIIDVSRYNRQLTIGSAVNIV